MTLAMALAWAGQGVIIVQVAHGAGRHIGDVDPDVYMVGMMVNFISQPIFLFAICVVKLAVGSSLLRIASTKMYRVIILSIMGFMVFYTVGCFFVSLLTHDAKFQLELKIHVADIYICIRPSCFNALISACSGTRASSPPAGHGPPSRASRTRTRRSTS